MNYIRGAKENFKDRQNRVSIGRIELETEKLRAERRRQAEIAIAAREKATLEKDVRNIKQFSEKHTPPSTIQKFGSGLARVMNEQKARGSSSTFGSNSRPSAAKKVGGKLSRINEGSRGIAFGGGNNENNPFSSGRRDLEYGKPAPVVTQQPKPKSKIILRY